MKNMNRIAAIGVATLFLTGCADEFWTSTVTRTTSLAPGSVMATTADIRMVTRASRNPEFVTCAEPSPDVAKAVAASFSGDLAAEVEGLKGVDGKLALAIAATRAEGMSQLGKRIATVQLLRDGLYRACEAYANGAINESTYALIVSRYDDVMVTMLLAEIAGGTASGLNLANLLTEASANSGAAVTPAEQMPSAENKSANTDVNESDGPREEEADPSTVSAAASGRSEAKAPPMRSPETRREDGDNARLYVLLENLQDLYIRKPSYDSIVVGCISALSQDQSSGTQLSALCSQIANNSRFLELVEYAIRGQQGPGNLEAPPKLEVSQPGTVGPQQ